MRFVQNVQVIWKEIAITVVAILVYLFAGLVFLPILEILCDSQHIVAYGAYILGALVAIAISDIAYGKWNTEDVETGIFGFSAKTAAFGVIGSFAIANIISGIKSIIDCFVQNDLITSGNVGTGCDEWSSIEVLVLVLATALVGPIAEELIFRGLLMRSLWKVFGLRKAVIASAVCFGLLHGNSVMTVVSAIFMGVVLAYTYAANKNLMDSIIAHLIYNTFVTYIAVHRVMPKEPVVPDISEVLPDVVPLILVSTFILMILGWIYKKKVLRR